MAGRRRPVVPIMPKDSDLPNILRGLFPGLGYFGAESSTLLRLGVNNFVEELVFSIESPSDEFLNLGTITFLDEKGVELPRSEFVFDLQISSIHGQRQKIDWFADFLQGNLLHTEREPNPYLRMFVNPHLNLGEVKVANRSDVFGSRSRFLSIRGLRRGVEVFSHRNLTLNDAWIQLGSVLARVGLDGLAFLNGGISDDKIHKFRESVLSLLDKDSTVLTEPELLALLKWVSPVEGFHLDVLAHLVLMKWEGHSTLETRILEPFKDLLIDDISVLHLESRIKAFAASYPSNPAEAVISKHLIHNASLRTEKLDKIELIRRLEKACESIGVEALLGYGTLLGAAREGRFLQFDDDVDLIVILPSRSKDAAITERERLISTLSHKGIEVSGTNFWHLQGDGFDLFPCWFEGEFIQLTMERLEIRPLRVDVVMPPSCIELEGESFKAPAKVSVFLDERYGAGWQIPDRFYEWPWPIQREAGSSAPESGVTPGN